MIEILSEIDKVNLIGCFLVANRSEDAFTNAKAVIHYIRALDNYRLRDDKGRFAKKEVPK